MAHADVCNQTPVNGRSYHVYLSCHLMVIRLKNAPDFCSYHVTLTAKAVLALIPKDFLSLLPAHIQLYPSTPVYLWLELL